MNDSMITKKITLPCCKESVIFYSYLRASIAFMSAAFFAG